MQSVFALRSVCFFRCLLIQYWIYSSRVRFGSVSFDMSIEMFGSLTEMFVYIFITHKKKKQIIKKIRCINATARYYSLNSSCCYV